MRGRSGETAVAAGRPSAKPILLVAALFLGAATGAVVTTQGPEHHVKPARPTPAVLDSHHVQHSALIEWLPVGSD